MTGRDLLARFLERDEAGDREGALKLLHDAFAAFNGGDRDTLLSTLAPDAEWVVPDFVLAGPVGAGPEGVTAFIDDQTEPFDEFRLEPETYERSGDRVAVVVRQHARGRASGAAVDIRVAQLWTIQDGLIVRFEGVPNVDEALRRLRDPDAAA